MKKIILNDGSYDKIDKKELNNNFHSTNLTLSQFKEFYDYSVKDLPFTRIELDDMPKLPYRELNMNETRSTRHIGQRKLLLSEIEFISLMYKKYDLKDKKKVILLYVGSAPGYHIPILVKLFPNLYFHLYDPEPYAIKEEPEAKASAKSSLCEDEHRKHIKIFNEYFVNKTVEKYYNKSLKKPLLFVSDIRDPFYDTSRTDQLQNDMRLQQEWVLGIKPLGAMFKFRLLFNDDITKYLYGNSYLPVWGPLTTTETRLICNKDDTNNWTKFKDYSNKDHEQRMFYFNNCYRMNLFDHNVNNVPGICHCFDCTSEVVIMTLYMQVMNPDVKITNNLIGDLMNENTVICKKTLYDANPNIEERLKNMQSRKNKGDLYNDKEAYEKYKKEN